jgi:hypothetical protein
MEIVAGAALICVAATVAIWANDHLPHSDADDLLLEAPAHETTH